jgi:CRP-like cAMP-binding protein
VGDPTTIFGLAHASGLLTLDGFARLAGVGERRVYAAGDRLMKQGDAADSLWVILSGKVSVVREHPDLASPIPLAQLGPGEVVGEMGLLDGDPRSATVTATEPTVTMEVSQSALSLVVAEHPELYAALVKTLSKRLRDTNELAAQIASTGDGAAPPNKP